MQEYADINDTPETSCMYVRRPPAFWTCEAHTLHRTPCSPHRTSRMMNMMMMMMIIILSAHHTLSLAPQSIIIVSIIDHIERRCASTFSLNPDLNVDVRRYESLRAGQLRLKNMGITRLTTLEGYYSTAVHHALSAPARNTDCSFTCVTLKTSKC